MKQFIRLMKALSDPNRVKIVKMLQRGERCVCEIQPALGLAQPTVSSHLKVLEQAGIVQGFRQGQWMHYSLTTGETPISQAMLENMRSWLEDDAEIQAMLAGLRDGNPGTSKRPLDIEGVCKVRHPMKAKRVLFICVHNSARSQMAEAFMNSLGKGSFEAASAGFEPREINPLVVEAMAEEGLDISGNKTKSVFDLFKSGRIFDYVITVCDDAREGQCPIFPGVTRRLHIPFTDPAALTGTHEEQMVLVRGIREAIKDKVHELMAEWSDETPKGKLA